MSGIVKRFAGLVALNGVSFHVARGDRLGLIGPNGAGKSVMVNTITGLYRPLAGTVRYRSEDITGLRPDLIVRRGIRRTFQHSTLFMQLSVADNLAVAVPATRDVSLADALFGLAARKERSIRCEVDRVLDLLNLRRHAATMAASLPYGLQKVVGMGIALVGSPELLLLDEPLTGLISAEVEEVMACIDRVNSAGVTVLLIEHNVRAVMSHCNRIVVLDFGSKLAEGSPGEIGQNARVIESYLGRPA